MLRSVPTTQVRRALRQTSVLHVLLALCQGKSASQRQSEILTNASSIPGLIAICTADTPVGAWSINTLPMGTKAGIHALIDICQETHTLWTPLGCPLQLGPQSAPPRQGCPKGGERDLPGLRQCFSYCLRILHPHLRADIIQQQNLLPEDVARARNVHGHGKGSANICIGLLCQETFITMIKRQTLVQEVLKACAFWRPCGGRAFCAYLVSPVFLKYTPNNSVGDKLLRKGDL